MREIKFRAWDKKLRIMWEPIKFERLLSYLFFQSMPNATAYTEIKKHFEDVIWLEYTGLLDKNGKEIYEGDLVHLDDWTPKAMQICFIDGAFCLADKDGEYLGDIHYTHHAGKNQTEVIGNIYENKELLNNSGITA